jgi:hypothetical protein
MINAVIISPAMDQALRCVELNLQDFANYQAGTMQAYELGGLKRSVHQLLPLALSPAPLPEF